MPLCRIDYSIDSRCLSSKNSEPDFFLPLRGISVFFPSTHYKCLISVAIVELGIRVWRFLYRINGGFGTSDDRCCSGGLRTSGFLTASIPNVLPFSINIQRHGETKTDVLSNNCFLAYIPSYINSFLKTLVIQKKHLS